MNHFIKKILYKTFLVKDTKKCDIFYLFGKKYQEM